MYNCLVSITIIYFQPAVICIYRYLADSFELPMPIFASQRSSFDTIPIYAIELLSDIVEGITN
jgi:hypothetical protein